MTHPVVYYVTRSDRPGQVKIGTSTSVMGRVKYLLYEGEEGSTITLLAVELGGRQIERARHARFAQMRIGTTEWFHFGAPIISHVMDMDMEPVVVADRHEIYHTPLSNH